MENIDQTILQIVIQLDNLNLPSGKQQAQHKNCDWCD